MSSLACLPIDLSKAELLNYLASRIKCACVLPQFSFSLSRWKKNTDLVLSEFHQLSWSDRELIIRSSAVKEDRSAMSMAGHYKSELNVKGHEFLQNAISSVADSLDSGEDQIFIQPMLAEVRFSGVAFTYEPNTGAPYYVINYDDNSGRTDLVTSGGGFSKTCMRVRGVSVDSSSHVNGVTALLSELEKELNTKYLDIEYAVTTENKLYLFQVRPLYVSQVASMGLNFFHDILKNISNKIVTLSSAHPYLYGEKTLFGIMPDWNPAEIIGIRPKPLALSLYRELVTDSIWAYQRDNYGYQNLRSFPLMVDFYGLPYIDVRASFNSFLPKDLDQAVSEKLVDYYLQRLFDNPNLHDKVEFEIIFSCYTLDLDKKLDLMGDYGFTKDDQEALKVALRKLTNNIISNNNGIWISDLKRIDELIVRHSSIKNSKLDSLSKVYWLIEDCKRYGTLPFAGLARVGFIAIALLKSLVNLNILNLQEYDAFLSGLNTVNTQMRYDFISLSKKDFLHRYGHLRPGSYDIESSRYDEAPDFYFSEDFEKKRPNIAEPTDRFSLDQLKKINSLLKLHGFEYDVINFFDFIRRAIESREYAKFIFTRSLSDVLALLGEYGNSFGVAREDMAYVNFTCLKNLYSQATDIEETIKNSCSAGKDQYNLTRMICLPPLIRSAEDVWCFHLSEEEPNYITQKSVFAKVASINDNLFNAIVFIPSADPGYDWIFSRNIAALITQYGGVNSHMAIRANEQGVPAIIGAGDINYRKWCKARYLRIDCANKKVEVIQ